MHTANVAAAEDIKTKTAMYAFLLLYFVEIKLINQETFSTVHLLKTPVFYTYILLLPFPVTKIRKSGWVGTFVLTILFAHLV